MRPPKDSTTLIISRDDVEKILKMPDAVDAVEGVFKEHGLGKVQMPAKIYLDLPEYRGDFRAMPAFIPSQKAAGVKWVNSHVDNQRRGFPSVMAALILNDPETAYPIAIMDATHITNVRTGAGGAVAAKYLAQKDSKSVAFIACGVQAQTALDALRQIFDFERILMWDPKPEQCETLKKKFPDLSARMSVASSAAEAVGSAQIVVTSTPSREPVIKKDWVTSGTHINAIGADAAGKQELEDALLMGAKIVVDDWGQASHSGEINVPLSRGHIKRESVYATLGEIVCGKREGRTSPEEITVFDSTGLAIQDMAVARKVFERAVDQGIGQRVKLL
jgi:alanine dehydrogenase